MKDNVQEKQRKSNPLAHVATGVVIGASVAAAGAAILQDKKNRDNVKKVVKNVKDQVSGHIGELRKKANEKKELGKAKIGEAKKDLKVEAKSSIDSTQKKLDEVKKNI